MSELRLPHNTNLSSDEREHRPRVKNTRCPSCVKSDVVVSKSRGFFDAALKVVVPTESFRCLGCYKRFYSYGSFIGNKARLVFWLAAVTFCLFAYYKISIAT